MISKMNEDKFIFREYRKGDFDGVIHIWVETNLGNSMRGDDESVIENSIRIGGSLIIMENISDGSICGTSWMTFDGRRIHLHHFGILPEYQGNGLSKILLKHSLEFVKKKGYQVKLEVHNSNNKAKELYKKAGFSYLGDYDIYIIRDLSKL
jgi:ribosomal protein S18 acetylase RimI-like enzyme